MAKALVRLLTLTLIVLATVVRPGLSAAAANDRPETALPLKSEQSARLPGGPGGHFAYYRFAYPGGWPMTIELRPPSADKAVLKYVGFKVYGPEPNREYVDGKLDDNGVWQGTRDLFSSDRGLYLVQVYSYYPDPTAAVDFTLLARGTPPQPAENEPVPGPVPGAAGHSAIPLEGVQEGSLPASTGGSFRYYAFTQAANTSVTINLQVSPGDAGTLTRAGFKLYGPVRDREYLQSEADSGRRPNQRGTLWVTQDGVYVVQVYNYNPQTPVEYTLWRGRP
ncbi:MAG TPA: hypothetical protein VGM69_01800 [Chloroflexota bacterium]|jgi:hypothetical protein